MNTTEDSLDVPISAAAHAAFAKALGMIPLSEGDDLVAMLAQVLQASATGVVTTVTPGDLATLVAVLEVFLSNADHAEEERSTEEGCALVARLGALIDFYRSQEVSTNSDRTQLLILSLAMSQIGTVVSSQSDPSNAQYRYGWERLNEIFLTAFGNESYDPNSVRYLNNQWLMSWCGIFGLWAYKTTGLPVGTWKMGSGISSVQGITQLPNTSQALPGDIGFIAQPNQHHFLIAAVDAGGNVTSVDGNTTATIHNVSRRGTIWRQERKLSDITAVYRPKKDDVQNPEEQGPAIIGTGMLVKPPPGTVGFDRSDTIAAVADKLYAAGYRFALRTVSLAGRNNPGVITPDEVKTILAAGLMLSLYQCIRNEDITPDQGTADGNAAATRAKELGAPAGLVLWCDLEGTFKDPSGKPVTPTTMLSYLKNWAAAVKAGGYGAGLYNGPQSLLGGQDLSSLDTYDAFWQAAALVPAIHRGYQMLQLYPGDYKPPGMGINIDIDVIQHDFAKAALSFWKG